ncbi:unnamed protein product [Cylicocyclus nassatus]|uniref:GOLD domain-containing protein n=1 Tax=Cylicocyclus nassatus TaxID=53992 RepID=A0AA36GPV3_CYLNA|nr:unnamed protein product [Cylicocyclus nassatus]
MCILILLPLISCSHALSRHSSIGNVSEVSRSIVMNLDARMTCLYETLEKNMTLSVSLSPMLDPFPMSLRLTSPSGQFSEWENGNDEVYMHHNVTEDGDYEICAVTSKPMQVALDIFFHDPKKFQEALNDQMEVHKINENLKNTVREMGKRNFHMYMAIRGYNKRVVRDQAMQQSNSDYIKLYVIIFCITNIVVGVLQVVIIHRMFFVDPRKIRV